MLLTFSISFLKDSMSILISVVSLSAMLSYLLVSISLIFPDWVYADITSLYYFNIDFIMLILFILYSFINVFFLLRSFCFLILSQCVLSMYSFLFLSFLIILFTSSLIFLF